MIASGMTFTTTSPRSRTATVPGRTEAGPEESTAVSVAEHAPTQPTVVLSFDVEEHHRIEAAAALSCPSDQRATYAVRMEETTRRILDRLAAYRVRATFYIVGEIARTHPGLIRDIAAAGHEIGSHGWDHRRVHTFTPESFRRDLVQSREALEEVSGTPVVGYRAPTFSVTRQTAWAVDVLAECGLRYDSSIFPVRHDRYGVPDAPRTPFLVAGPSRSLLELPPTTWRLAGQNLPVAGGGYFRLFPPFCMDRGIAQQHRLSLPVAMLYFHPWEFDPGQPRLPLGRMSRWRTYVGITKSNRRLERLLQNYQGLFCRAIDIVNGLDSVRHELPRFQLGSHHD
ncbi:MAG: polysaccharide deacetylase family protein [Bacteroidales bacterium]|nr:polysaccharide deacetylase family protein [Bacteroidales bacterium]